MSGLERKLINELAQAQQALKAVHDEVMMLRELTEIRHCEVCGTPFAAMKNRGARFCSTTCKVKSFNERNK